MSDANDTGTDPVKTSLDLGGDSYIPTQPASQFLGLLPDQPAPAAPTGPSPSQYAVYDPATAEPPSPAPAASQPIVQQYGTPVSETRSFVPGQIVPTEHGNFVVGKKSKLAAGLLGILLGGFGAGQFYRGNTSLGVAQLVVTIVTAGAGGLWGFIEGILVLVAKPGTALSLDSEGQLLN